jgi:hypothetical protein
MINIFPVSAQDGDLEIQYAEVRGDSRTFNPFAVGRHANIDIRIVRSYAM